MDSIERKYYDEFEHGLLRDMLRLCTSAGMLDGNLLQSEDIDGKWDEIAPEYLADVLRQMNEYPEVSFGWAGYIGMAVAEWWDQDWEKNSRNGYTVLYGKRGFDDMDDHIVEDVLGYTRGSLETKALAGIMFSCARMAMDRIRHEQVESQTEKASSDIFLYASSGRFGMFLFRVHHTGRDQGMQGFPGKYYSKNEAWRFFRKQEA